MFNKYKLTTNKFASVIKDTFAPSTTPTDDISREDLELLFDSQQQQQGEEYYDHKMDSMMMSLDVEKKDAVSVMQEDTHHAFNIDHPSHDLVHEDEVIEVMKRRIGFDETEFRSQLTSLFTSTQSTFKEQVDSLYDLIDAHVNRVSQSFLMTQRGVMQEVEALIKEIRKNVMEVEEMEQELNMFMVTVQSAYEKAFPRLRSKE